MSNPALKTAAPLIDDEISDPTETPFYIPATDSPSRPRRTLKHGDTFAVFDDHGDIGASAGGADGVYFDDTRFLSRLELTLNGMQALLLGSNIRDDNTQLTVDLTNPDMYFDEHLLLPKDTLHIVRTVFLWQGTAYQRISLRNHGDRAIVIDLSFSFGSAWHPRKSSRPIPSSCAISGSTRASGRPRWCSIPRRCN
jgi:glycogen debranching enzyme